MRKVAIILLCTLACTQKAHNHELEWKKVASSAADERVSNIIAQLQEDCDSTLMQIARAKADSIITLRNRKTMDKRR